MWEDSGFASLASGHRHHDGYGAAEPLAAWCLMTGLRARFSRPSNDHRRGRVTNDPGF